MRVVSVPSHSDERPGTNRSRIFAPGLLDGQLAIVSGGGSGLGRATALELAALGARVVVCGRRAEPLAETASLGPEDRIEPVACDIREEDQVSALVDGVTDRFGRIDLLVNNAGGQFLSPAEEITPKGFRTVIRLNVEGTWLMTHTVATRAMIPARAGKVVSITISPHNGLPSMAHSSAARAAVESLTRVLSVEWSRFGIALNAIAAGQIATDTLTTKYPRPIVDALADTIPLGRLGAPDEIAWLVAYLASPAGDFISGAVLTVDGARDNWFGGWPPSAAADAHGRPLAEQRRPGRPPPRA
jgi:citronellol/citronellal dehydrogenase